MKKSSLSTTLYIIHGWTHNVDNWQPLLDLLKLADFKVKMLKVPGLTRPSKQAWSIDDYVGWLAKELQDVDKPVVLAHSNGGRIALNFCLQHPRKMKHLILLNSAGVPPSVIKNLYLLFVQILSKIFGFLKKNRLIRRAVYALLRVQDYSRATPNMKLTLRNMLASDGYLAQRLIHIKTPVSLIWGESDSATPLSQGLFLYNQLPGAVAFYNLQDAGHTPYAHQPDAVYEAILKIYKQL